MTQAVPFLSRVKVANYRSIASCDVSFIPLVVLLGPNGAGKSNFIDALRFVADALETTPATAVTQRGGLTEILRQVPEPTDHFSIDLEFTISTPGGAKHGEYGFVLGHDSGARRPFVVKSERCVVRQGQEETRFDVQAGLIVGGGGIERDRLYLPVAAAQGSFTEIFYGLRGMLFHHLDTEKMRAFQSDQRTGRIGPSGEDIGTVLGELAFRHPVFKSRIDDYLKAIVPGVEGMDQRVYGTRSTVELRTRQRREPFGPDAISEGTLHAAGVLAALFQPAVLDAEASLIAIEEPETALHPAATGAMFDALTEASERVQVVITTQSPDLLDHDDFDPGWVRVVTMENGVTLIGDIDDAGRKVVEERLATLGELMRGRQLRPRGAE
ncbi:AAA family ATPase [Sinosporangium siamense]|uniref:Chromosome segregation protein SMC n=1 Tax=Sinosporangium siamense TaxID=1367973 RepID=A0A919RKT4_9ACTN|nr:AAA family ATPase [Sinosporangium siamense]GII95052.1 chromosome segregation protein SMC [Sinosporangium siamense]